MVIPVSHCVGCVWAARQQRRVTRLTTSTTQQDELTAGSAPYGERRITEYRTDDAAAVAEMFNGSQDGWPGGFGGGQHFTAEMVRDYVDSDRPLAVFSIWGYADRIPPSRLPALGAVAIEAAARDHRRAPGRKHIPRNLGRIRAVGKLGELLAQEPLRIADQRVHLASDEIEPIGRHQLLEPLGPDELRVIAARGLAPGCTSTQLVRRCPSCAKLIRTVLPAQNE